ncbi:MAG: hypothetical protein KAR08_00080 [Candidatus Heimdallarchaeota archaeon]|nr:hypothetical protein [Candidatus Heimdallarchaeota archaeon]
MGKRKTSIILTFLLIGILSTTNLEVQQGRAKQQDNDSEFDINNPVAAHHKYHHYFIVDSNIYCVDYKTIDVYNFTEPTETKLHTTMSYPIYNEYSHINGKVLFDEDEKIVHLTYNRTSSSENINLTLDFTFNIFEVQNSALSLLSNKTFYFELGGNVKFNFYYEDHLLYFLLYSRHRLGELIYSSEIQLITFNFTDLLNPSIIDSQVFNVEPSLQAIRQMTKKEDLLYYTRSYESKTTNNDEYYLTILNISDPANPEKLLDYKLAITEPNHHWFSRPKYLVFYKEFLLLPNELGVAMINCSNPLLPFLINVTLANTDKINHFIVNEDIIYTLNGDLYGFGSIDVFSVSNTIEWLLLSTYDPNNQGEGLYVNGEIIGNLMIVIRYSEYEDRQLLIFNIENPVSLELLYPKGKPKLLSRNNEFLLVIMVTIIMVCGIKRKRRKKQ